VRFGSHLAVAAAAGRGRGPGWLKVELPPLTSERASCACKPGDAEPSARSTHHPHPAWSCDRL